MWVYFIKPEYVWVTVTMYLCMWVYVMFLMCYLFAWACVVRVLNGTYSDVCFFLTMPLCATTFPECVCLCAHYICLCFLCVCMCVQEVSMWVLTCAFVNMGVVPWMCWCVYVHMSVEHVCICLHEYMSVFVVYMCVNVYVCIVVRTCEFGKRRDNVTPMVTKIL